MIYASFSHSYRPRGDQDDRAPTQGGTKVRGGHRGVRVGGPRGGRDKGQPTDRTDSEPT